MIVLLVAEECGFLSDDVFGGFVLLSIMVLVMSHDLDVAIQRDASEGWPGEE